MKYTFIDADAALYILLWLLIIATILLLGFLIYDIITSNLLYNRLFAPLLSHPGVPK